MADICLPPLICVGFFPKITVRQPTPPVGPNVEEVCSVSNCISGGPAISLSAALPDWTHHWKHNDLGFYDTESLAREQVPANAPEHDLYAYKVYPLRFDAGVVTSWQPRVDLACDLVAYDRLGCDIVSRSMDNYPECSPLSCNYAASDFAANRFCLIDDPQQAYAAAVAISKGTYEPGPYYLFEVHRRPKRFS